MENQPSIFVTRSGMDLSIFLVYLTVVFVTLRGLAPGMRARPRLIVAAALAAQMVVIVTVLFAPLPTGNERWLWNTENEFNLVSLVATMQFALVGCAGLMTCWIATERPTLHRAFFAFVGLLFLYFTVDEYYEARGSFASWWIYYSAFGLALVLSSALIAYRSPRRTWKWYAGFVFGLAISALGAIVLDILPWTCGVYGLPQVRVDRCLDLWRLEEISELTGVWMALVALCALYSDAKRAAERRKTTRILYLAPLAFVLLVTFPLLRSTVEMRLTTRPLRVQFESKVQLEAMSLQYRPDAVDLKLYVSASEWNRFNGLGYSLHLVDQVSSQSIASWEENISRVGAWQSALFDPFSRYSESMRINIPPSAAANRAMWLVLTLWREEDGRFSRRKIISSDRRLLSDTQVVLDEFVIKSRSETDATATLATFENGFALESATLPASIRLGDALNVTFSWRSSQASGIDYHQFLHLQHQETGEWWGFDQQPLGARLPTRLWYSQLADSEVWHVPVPDDLQPGRYAVFTGLYALGGQERLPGHGAAGDALVDAMLPLGSLLVEAS